MATSAVPTWTTLSRDPSPPGHQLHFDSDDEGVGGVRNPIISSVVYLSSSSPSGSSSAAASGAVATEHGGSVYGAVIGGPTLVTDQRLCGELATKGWLAYPAINRVTMFDGRVLHGKACLSA